MESHVNVAKALSGLLQKSTLNGHAGSAQTSKLSNAVQKFEAFFIQSMLKSMRGASLASGLFESDKSNFYRDWHDQQLAGDLASKESFAVANLLRGQFSGETVQPTPSTSLTTDPLFRRSAYSQIGKSTIPNKTTLKQLVTKEITETALIPNKTIPSTPELFVQQVYPHAQRAATKLNTSADVLVAIAALETGWGLHTPKTKLNQDSYNYFGIKANNWNGPAVTSPTREFDGNNMIDVNDSFRAYTSPAESFDDFAEFLLNSSRYRDALKISHDDQIFVKALQNAGYATDPNYANKVISILDGSILKDAISSQIGSEQTANITLSLETNTNTLEKRH